MGLDAGEFFELLKNRDLKRAKEWVDGFYSSLPQGDDFSRGYALALQGMVLAMNGRGESLVERILDGKQNVDSLVRDIGARISLGFRPKDEQGFDRAWLDFLQSLKK
jgi:hypothetical protein